MQPYTRVRWSPPRRRRDGYQPTYRPEALVLSVGKRTAHIQIFKPDGTSRQRYIKLSRLVEL